MTGPRRLACQTEDADLWFAERPETLARAQALCLGCSVRQDCLAEVLHRREPWGVWGGQIVQRGAVVADKRGRGRRRTGRVARVSVAPR
jgi:WhiB family redox-sensing transcriptional regulator